MNQKQLKDIIAEVAAGYSIKRIILFGSRADGTNSNDSDVDLIVEFYDSVSILTLSQLRCDLEEALGLSVDLIHGPLRDTDLIEPGAMVELYAA